MGHLEEWSPLDDEFSRGFMKMTGRLDEAGLAGQASSLITQRWPFDEPAPAGGPTNA